MIWRKLATYMLLMLIVSVCSNKPDCLVADTVQKIESEALRNKGLYLYLRTTGFNEKEHFYELYKDAPVFDECGKVAIAPAAQAHVDTTIGTPIKLIVKNDQMKIEYSSGEDDEGHEGQVLNLES